MMSIIVDANCSADAMRLDPAPDFAPIIAAFVGGTAKLTYGGTKLLSEYRRVGAAWRFLLMLDRAGKSRKINDVLVDAEQDRISSSMDLRSDDPHVLALARISGARLLCSRDGDLHQDFRNADIISRPRGFVYQDASHRHLIRKCCKVKAGP
jgi:hypothetical protein